MSLQHFLVENEDSEVQNYDLWSSLHFMQGRMRHEVRVDNNCRLGEVSRVTFFKLFPNKEDILFYFMC